MLALVVGTAINLYGHALVPWLRGVAHPFSHFADEFAREPGVVGASVLVAYCFPMLVGLYASVTTRLGGLDQERELLRLASFPEKNPNPVIEVDLEGQVTYVNPLAEERFPKLDIRGSKHPMLRGLPRIVKKLRKRLRGSRAREAAVTREVSVGKHVYQQNIVLLPDVDLVRLYTADITDRKRAENDLVRLASFPEGNPNPVIEVALDGSVQYVNPLARERFPNLAGTRTEHPLLVGLVGVVETIKKTKAPHSREVEVRGFIYRQNIVYLPESQLVRLYIHDVTTLRELQARIQRSLAELEKAHKELADAQVQLVDSEKRAALSQLVAGIAHEINTPVGAIHSTHSTLQRAAEKMARISGEKFAEGSKEQRQLEALVHVFQDAARVIATASERVTTIVTRMRNFARLDEAELKTVSINECIESTLELCRHELTGRIEVVEALGEIPNINCFPARINQALLSVIMNAVQAIEGTGRIWLTTRADEEVVTIEVRDDGRGIPEENQAEIFDAGFTTKGVGVGSGLGLSICQQTFHDHGGVVAVDSALGEGTTITMTLPLTGVSPPPSLLGE